MRFVRFDDEVINLDLVKKATLAEDKVLLYFIGDAVSLGKEKAEVKHYKGEQAKALYDFFLKNSEELGPPRKKSIKVG